jgi:2-methylcitrate dehydratase PrpD
MQAMQKRIVTESDPEIEKLGFEKMRSRIAIRLKNGNTLEGWADERYRGGPDNPLSDAELEAKVHSCCEGVLEHAAQSNLIDTARSITTLSDVTRLMQIINGIPGAATPSPL